MMARSLMLVIMMVLMAGCEASRAAQSVDRRYPEFVADPAGPITNQDQTERFAPNPGYHAGKVVALKTVYFIGVLPVDILIAPVALGVWMLQDRPTMRVTTSSRPPPDSGAWLAGLIRLFEFWSALR